MPADYGPTTRNMVELVKAGKSEEAMAVWKKAGRPDDPTSLAVVAAAQLAMKQFAPALETAERALHKTPHHVSALVTAAKALQNLNRTSEATAHWLHVLRVKPDHQPAIKAVQQLAAGSADPAQAAGELSRALEFTAAAPQKLAKWQPSAPLHDTPQADLRKLYLDLMVRTVSGWILEDGGIDPSHKGKAFDGAARECGRDWPRLGHSMIGLRRLQQLREACESVIAAKVPGDFIETGVWRGGACILMRAVLTSYGVTDRNVWVADSFAGVPDEASYAPNDHFNEYSFHQYSELAVSRAAVTDNFRRYGLLDDQVRFLEGWFADTLAPAPIERIAVLRLDGDLYSSTWQALEALYPKVSAGGFIIIDDYGSVPSARLATLDYRRQHAIAEPIQAIDDDGAFWIKG